MIGFLLAQMRFPKPEFSSGYEVPAMDVEKLVSDPAFARVWLLALMLLLTVWALFRMRSRKMVVGITFLNIVVLGFWIGGCICPVGLIQQTALAVSDVSAPYTLWYALLFTLPLGMALFFGRIFCTGGCPLGAFQELLCFKPLHVPAVWDRLLRVLPFIILTFGTALILSGAGFWLCAIDPYVGFFHQGGTHLSLGLGLFMVGIGFFIYRPFCRWVCPYGLLLKGVSLFSRKTVKICEEDCVECRLCESACPLGAVLPPAAGRRDSAAVLTVERLLAVLPLGIAGAGFAGWFAGLGVALLHPDVQLLEALHHNIASDETRAFLQSGTSLETLTFQVSSATLLIQKTCAVGFGISAFLIGISLIRDVRVRKAKGYTVDPAQCVCCGRCYGSCPLNMKGGTEGL